MTAYRIHIGAHKTATTHFQDTLFQGLEQLQSRNINYISRAEFRGKKIGSQIRRSFSGMSFFGDRTALREILEHRDFVADTILISEENILGPPLSLLEDFYSDALRRLRPWQVLLNGESLTLYVSIRNYSEILPSAFSQVLRQGICLPPFDHVLRHWMLIRPSWLKLIQSLRVMFGETNLVVWSFSRYVEDPIKIVNEFAGIPLNGIDMSRVNRNARMSAESILKIQRLDSSLPSAERMNKIREIERAATGVPFDPISAKDRAIMDEWYLEDCEKLAALGIQCIL